MAENEERLYRHITLRDDHVTREDYTYPYIPFDDEIKLRTRSRNDHSKRLASQLEKAQSIQERLKKAREQDVLHDDGTYLDVLVQVDDETIISRLQDDRYGIEIVNIRFQDEIYIKNEGTFKQFEVTLFIPDGKLDKLLGKIEDFREKDWDSGKPYNLEVVSSIEEIKLATLKSFWAEEDIPFPKLDKEIWWEVWFRKNNRRVNLSGIERIKEQIEVTNLELGVNSLEFPEHKIFLIKGNAKDLSNSVLLLNSLAELRKAKTRASFFTDHLNGIEQEDWIDEFKDRISKESPYSTICLLDSGVNNGNPLLKNIISDKDLDSINPSWLNNDSYPGPGHGTLMAGIAAFGDLTPLLSGHQHITLYHDLKSIKIYNHKDPNDPDLYGAITKQACSRALIEGEDNNKIFCMAVTTKEFRESGKPSSWSSAVDQILFESIPNGYSHLFVISGGNVHIKNAENYPNKNFVEEVDDPGQSWNALTVGCYTNKENFNREEFSDFETVAKAGEMGPANSTSLTWEDDWPYKPDFTLEGGNLATNGIYCSALDDLQPVSTRKDFINQPLGTFGDTSAATAEAARLAAKIYEDYPEFWPETVRALLVHSSEWTPEMLMGKEITDFSTKKEIKDLIKSVGYGVPNLTKAKYSANNSLNLISEQKLKPFKKGKNGIKTNELHYYELPWPKEVLQNELASETVFLNVTLSYYIEPNPGKRYSSRYYYQSHGLRFDVKRSSESLDDFLKRKNKVSREEEEKFKSYTSTEDWVVGNNGRTSGSIHKDIWYGTGRDLAEKNHLVVYPITGWWKTRHNLERYNSTCRYSLIISIESPEVEIDLYTPVLNQVAIVT